MIFLPDIPLPTPFYSLPAPYPMQPRLDLPSTPFLHTNDTNDRFHHSFPSASTRDSPSAASAAERAQNAAFAPLRAQLSAGTGLPFGGRTHMAPDMANDARPRTVPVRAPPDVTAQRESQFDIFEWYPKYQSCQRYFLQHAQHSPYVQAVAAFINIHLPFHYNHARPESSVEASPSQRQRPTSSQSMTFGEQTAPQAESNGSSVQATSPVGPISPPVSLHPYLRRLVVTGMDNPGVLHGFFGDDWAAGIGPQHEQERRNYLFAAKSGGWAVVKAQYDVGTAGSLFGQQSAPSTQALPALAEGISQPASGGIGPGVETVPFMRPLHGVTKVELEAAEQTWSEWLALEDWMVGPRAPETLQRPTRTVDETRRHHDVQHHGHVHGNQSDYGLVPSQGTNGHFQSRQVPQPHYIHDQHHTPTDQNQDRGPAATQHTHDSEPEGLPTSSFDLQPSTAYAEMTPSTNTNRSPPGPDMYSNHEIMNAVQADFKGIDAAGSSSMNIDSAPS